MDGVTNDTAAALATLRAIRRFAEQEPTMLRQLTIPEGPVRLAAGSVLGFSPGASSRYWPCP